MNRLNATMSSTSPRVWAMEVSIIRTFCGSSSSTSCRISPPTYTDFIPPGSTVTSLNM